MQAVPHYDHIDNLPDYWHEPEARFALGQLELSGLTMAGFARRHGIRVEKLRRWRRRLDAERDDVRFVQLTVAQTPQAEVTDEPFRLRLGRIEIDVPPGFCEDDLARLLGVLEC